MKTIVIILAVSVVAVLGEVVTDEQRARLKIYKESCISETGVNPTAIENAKRGELDENDEKLACFSNCLLKKIGILNAEGNINLEVVRAKIPSSVSQDQIDQIINKCQNVGGTGCQKGAHVFKCFLETKTFSIL